MADGRTKFTRNRCKTILHWTRKGKTTTQVARRVGISVRTLHNWLAKGRAPGAPLGYQRFAYEFDVAVEVARELWEQRIEDGDLITTEEEIEYPDGTVVKKKKTTRRKTAAAALAWLRIRHRNEYEFPDDDEDTGESSYLTDLIKGDE